MGFEAGKRTGKLWDDMKELDALIKNFPFNTTGKCERDFENGFSSVLLAQKDKFKNKVITQIARDSTVESVFCFGKKHRPDLTINENGIAIEIKFVSNTLDGFKQCIGQSYIYRLKYKFTILILVISEANKELYESIEKGQEDNLIDILNHLAVGLNIFTYIVPAFNVKTVGVKKCISSFEEN